MAVSEAFAHWFSILAQKEELTANLGVANAGDLSWSKRFHLETNVDDPVHSIRGEDNEVAIARILWDLYDTVVDENEKINDAYMTLINQLKGATKLSDFWNKISKPLSLKRKVDYSIPFINHGVAPKILKSDTDLKEGSVLKWKAQGTLVAYHLDEFKLLFADAALGSVIYTLAVPKADTQACSKRGYINDNPDCAYKLKQKDVDAIKAAFKAKGLSGDQMKWLVEGRATRVNPVTGWYISKPLNLGVPSVAMIWDTNYGELIITKLDNGHIIGTYDDDENGKLYLKPLGNGVYRGTWSEDLSDEKCEVPHEDGRFYWGTLTLNIQDSFFEGVWGYCGREEAHEWVGELRGTE
ncbi:MAG: hypothetical protein HRT44_04820 [Bdellovibrionales bacterium]|nr:hypothetical protein [Bdellovibrionales bacterium]